MIIDELEARNFRVVINPIKSDNKWYWSGGVKIGNDNKINWVSSNLSTGLALYKTYTDALKAIVAYCNNYKPNREISTKGSKRNKV